MHTPAWPRRTRTGCWPSSVEDASGPVVWCGGPCGCTAVFMRARVMSRPAARTSGWQCLAGGIARGHRSLRDIALGGDCAIPDKRGILCGQLNPALRSRRLSVDGTTLRRHPRNPCPNTVDSPRRWVSLECLQGVTVKARPKWRVWPAVPQLMVAQPVCRIRRSAWRKTSNSRERV